MKFTGFSVSSGNKVSKYTVLQYMPLKNISCMDKMLKVKMCAILHSSEQ